MGGLTWAFNLLHLPTKAPLSSLRTPSFLHRWESLSQHPPMSTSTSHDAMVLKRTGSVKIFKRFLFKFLNVLLKNPFKLFSRVTSVNEFRSLIEIAGALHSKEKGTKRTTEDKHIMSGLLDRKECEKVVVDLLSASTMGNVVPQGIVNIASRAAYTVDGELPVPEGERWAVAARGVDFSGKWQLRADDKFKEDYDRYLATLGQPLLVRTVAVGLLGRTKEEIMMSESGKSLLIRGENARGIWERKLISSGTEVGKPEFEPKHFPIMVSQFQSLGRS